MLFYFYGCLYLFASKQGTAPFHWYAAHIFQSLYYLPLVIFFEELKAEAFTLKLVKILALAVIIVSLVQCYNRKEFNQSRIAVIDTYLQAAQAANIQKGILDHKHEGNRPEYWFWALEYESLILAKYRYDETRTLIYKAVEDYCDTCPSPTTEFIAIWGNYDLSEFNGHYFPFNHEPYEVVPLIDNQSAN